MKDPPLPESPSSPPESPSSPPVKFGRTEWRVKELQTALRVLKQLHEGKIGRCLSVGHMCGDGSVGHRVSVEAAARG